MDYKTFNKSKLATSLSLILGASAMNVAYAAEETTAVEQDVEVIEVTGIRGSLTKAMDIKRSSSGIVEAINAEDIGKFPDSNLAESLQRISGVAIDRNNGEGSKVTVRGFGPDRNLVLLNGRQMPTTTGDRSFDFANIASEGVSGAEIYKTSDASIATGGIGATINILTHRPMNNPGMVATFGVKAVDDTSADDGDLTPELSGLYSNTFADDKFGISISGSYSERESGNQQAEVGTGWRSFTAPTDQDWSGAPGSQPEWGGVPKDGQVNRPTGVDEIYSVPQTTIYKFEEQQRERINGQVVFQYAPTDNFKATLDVTHMSNEIDRQYNDVSAWYTFAPSENVWTDGPVSSPLYYSENYGADNKQDLSMGAGMSGTKAESNSIGINLEWQVNDNLWLELDHHSSEAEETPNSPYGSSNVISTAGFIREAAATDFTGDLPILAVRGANGVTKADMLVTGSWFRNDDNRSEIDQTQINGKYELDEYGSIDFGVGLLTSNKHNRAVQVQRNDWGGVGAAGDLAGIGGDIDSVQNQFDDVDGGNFENHPDGPDGFEIVDTIFMWDFAELRDFAEANYTPDNVVGGGDCGTLFCPSSDYSRDTDRFVEEEVTSIYAQWNYEGEIGDMPFEVQVGIRYEETEIDSTSVVPDYTGNRTTWVGDTEFVIAPSELTSAQSKSGSYDHTLPNFNFNLEVTDDIILRAAYSETIGRAWYGDLQGGTTIGTTFNKSGASGSSGNPNLEPLESTNYDLEASWFYSDSSYVSLGWFQKDVTNWIQAGTINDTLFDLRHPGDGPKLQAALAAGITDAGQQKEWIFDNYGDNPEVYKDENGNILIDGIAEDELVEFLIGVKVNDDIENTFDGIEFAVQHIFGDTGFGTFANYTMVDAGDDYNNLLLTGGTATTGNQDIIGGSNDGVQTGISDTANLVFFYENYGISARIAYNWRDEYLEATYQGTGGNPVYVEEYEQIDFNVNYTFQSMEQLSIFVEGINITDEFRRKHGRSSTEVLNVTQQGARYSVGARYTF
ncbi:TonB-dependent receptor [Thalassomonas sp. M1454]|uniref:TonB-dependent receptor n=1 Tax=Thalassomonas sp. M1454 TaxID=2594477 RepID=UPI00117CE6F1|nr:TonB-dependent receptor [Thalassomonas sp. M1454]TRX53831.1 TonB-dependent receptor [Thalassomonas sp. M1454]